MQNDLDFNIIYEDRSAASKELIDILPINIFDSNETVVVAVSEGGVYFADKIASHRKIDMDILLSIQIFAPNNSELAIAIVTESEDMVINNALIDSFEIDEDYIYSEANRKYEEFILPYIYKYRKSIPMRSLKGKHVILTDESIESGLTISAALKSMIEMGVKSIYVAVPVLDYSVYDNLQNLCDGVFCPHIVRDYISIEYYYKTLEKIEFDDLELMINENGITDYKRK